MRLLFGICFCLRRLTCRMYNPSHAKVSEIKIQWQLCYWFPPWEGALHSQPVAWAERHHLWVRIQHNPLAWNTDGLFRVADVAGREGFPGGGMFFETWNPPPNHRNQRPFRPRRRPQGRLPVYFDGAARLQTAGGIKQQQLATKTRLVQRWTFGQYLGMARHHGTRQQLGRQHSQELGLIVGKWT